MKKTMKKIEKKAIDITVDVDAGRDSYHIIVGPRGSDSHIYRNGEELKYIEELHLDMKANEIPSLELKKYTIKGNKDSK